MLCVVGLWAEVENSKIQVLTPIEMATCIEVR